ncbi:formylglycine-generating enzyme family protein [Leptospira sp. WS39.C2]
MLSKHFLFFILVCNTVCSCISYQTNSLLFIKGGNFLRGRNITNRPDEAPRHTVVVSDFYIQETLVTRKQYQNFVSDSMYKTSAEKKGYCMISLEGMKDWEWEKKMGANFLYPFGKQSNIPTRDDDPVVCVSYLDAKAYCEFYQMRLPTEAEWEYVARAGGNGRYPWGETESINDQFFSNFWQAESHTSSDSKDGYSYFSPTKAFPSNQWGMYDAIGNVWQFTNDYYDSQTYLLAYQTEKQSGIPVTNPKGPTSGTKVVARGGSWWCSEKTCKGHGLFYRGKIQKDSPFNNNGFRCVKDVNP